MSKIPLTEILSLAGMTAIDRWGERHRAWYCRPALPRLGRRSLLPIWMEKQARRQPALSAATLFGLICRARTRLSASDSR